LAEVLPPQQQQWQQRQQPVFDFGLPTLVLSEVALIYLAAKASDSLLSWVARRLRQGYVALYEQVQPKDGFGQVMQRHFESIESPLLTLSAHPSMDDQLQRHLSCGLEPVHASDMNEVLSRVPLEERRRILQLEPFDEFEEWRLTCGHYLLICSRASQMQQRLLSEEGTRLPSAEGRARPDDGDTASATIAAGRGEIDWFADSLVTRGSARHEGGRSCALTAHTSPNDVTVATTDSSDAAARLQAEFAAYCEESNCCSRYSHCACEIRGGVAFIFGGNGPRGRLATASLVETATLRTTDLCTEAPVHAEGPVHAACVAISSGVLILGGRTAPSGVGSREEGMPVTLVRLGRQADNHSLASAQAQTLQLSACARPTRRWRHTAVRVSLPGAVDSVMVFGGRNAKVVFSDLWLLDAVAGIWRQLEVGGPHQPSARHSHAAVAIPPAEDLLGAGSWAAVMLISGGLDVDENPLQDAFVLELRSRSSVLSSAGQPQSGGCSSACDDALRDSGAFVEARWRNLEPAQSAKRQLSRRFGHTAHVWRHRHIVLAGGVVLDPLVPGCEAPLELLSLEPADNSSHALASVRSRAVQAVLWSRHGSNPFLTHGHASVLFGDELLVLGGGGACFSFGIHVNNSVLRIPLAEVFGDCQIDAVETCLQGGGVPAADSAAAAAIRQNTDATRLD